MNIEERTKQKFADLVGKRYTYLIGADIEVMASNMYESAKDQDYQDYEDTKEQDIKELQDALYNLEAIARNEYNKDYFRTLYNALILIFDK